ncbi:tubulin/FtsZ family protein [Natrarchaeobaculum aegyptiacum]|uniref:Tubulin-like protein CetZ n=1 Tax=Natrarchaeobaculum aegyptiacum TaxID=745377 RepID=A0A2Z2HV24_9EURY|nr:tubulin/FtsZ family protein [Natrarchaeobaculum aegyptiacum]ARS90015.1 hypothetical protein B1756_09930 [Natrarchaeobaculum aegyptiacum]
MKLAFVGVGGAGTRIVDRLLAREAETDRTVSRGNAIVFDTAEPGDAFRGVEHVPEECRVTFGDVHPDVGPAGTGGNPDLGVAAAREDVYELRRAFDALEFTDVDGAVLVAGLAGGTGGGAGAVLLEELQEVCDDPVYALAVLPSADEPAGRALTAARSLQSFVRIADNVVCFDNEAWDSEIGPLEDLESRTLSYEESVDADAESTDDSSPAVDADADADADSRGPSSDVASDDPDAEDDSPPHPYETVNRAAADRLLSILGAGELESMTIAENRIDASDVARTLETGGVSTIGQATLELEQRQRAPDWLPVPSWLPASFRGWLTDSPEDSGPTDAARVKDLVQRAVESRLTVPCAVDSADRTLIVLSGPPSSVSRKGFESARHWLEGEADTVDVMAGDEPRDAAELTATVLLSNVTEVPPVEAVQERALEALELLEDRDGRKSTANADDAAGENEFIW